MQRPSGAIIRVLGRRNFNHLRSLASNMVQLERFPTTVCSAHKRSIAIFHSSDVLRTQRDVRTLNYKFAKMTSHTRPCRTRSGFRLCIGDEPRFISIACDDISETTCHTLCGNWKRLENSSDIYSEFTFHVFTQATYESLYLT